MNTLRHTAQWVFALVISVIAYFATMAAFAFLFVWLEGLQVGAPMPADYHLRTNPLMFRVIVNCTVFVPLIVSAFFGAITAPNAQRGVALVAFPLLVFLV